ncbi:MAG TPA: ATP-binding cassette domain-containing protein [Rhizomicrobium sp.]|nr:ATP-binding cassette domain-containing protein [Rhizomicrobium sp.]
MTACTPLLELHDVSVRFEARGRAAVETPKLSLVVNAEEAVALIGASGSGKTQAMYAVMGVLEPNARAEGAIFFRGRELLGLEQGELNRIRGVSISMIFQDPGAALDPMLPVGRQIGDVIRYHRTLPRASLAERIKSLLQWVGLEQEGVLPETFPHQISGGQRQRVMIAMALSNDPAIIIADEATSALDAIAQQRVVRLLVKLKAELGIAVLFVTHDLNLARVLADRVYVTGGGAAEDGNSRATPSETRVRPEPASAGDGVPVLEAVNLSARHEEGFGVSGLSFALERGRTVCLVGASGSGKTTAARALLRLMPSGGSVRFRGRELPPPSTGAMRFLRRHIQMVFQDPFTSLSPRMTVEELVSEGLREFEPGLSRDAVRRRVLEMLAEVGLDENLLHRRPSGLSGGQRQRVAIARAAILHPDVLVLDEPTSALDRQSGEKIWTLLERLRIATGMSYVLITHDVIDIARHHADWILVMKDGAVVEQGAPETILERPAHAYTRELIDAARCMRLPA